ncbi:unnamed protein product, partial [Ectocarpus sp. 8 AP-2014]
WAHRAPPRKTGEFFPSQERYVDGGWRCGSPGPLPSCSLASRANSPGSQASSVPSPAAATPAGTLNHLVTPTATGNITQFGWPRGVRRKSYSGGGAGGCSYGDGNGTRPNATAAGGTPMRASAGGSNFDEVESGNNSFNISRGGGVG